MDDTVFLEDNNGVHFRDPNQPEFTLCGYAVDAYLTEGEEEAAWGPMIFTRKRTVTCPACVRTIRAVRGIHTQGGA